MQHVLTLDEILARASDEASHAPIDPADMTGSAPWLALCTGSGRRARGTACPDCGKHVESFATRYGRFNAWHEVTL